MANRRDNGRMTGCPIAFALDILGDKWSLLIVRDMLFKGKRNYIEFLESGEKIATNVLADRLKRLEANGVIVRNDDPGNRKKVIYSLTDKGMDLLPMLLEMISWGAKYDEKTAAPQEFLRRLRKDRTGLTDEITSGLRKVRKQRR